jgi:site-specific recombinase XerC
MSWGAGVGTVFSPDGTPRGRIRLRSPRTGARARFLPDALEPKLRAFWRYKQRTGEGLEDDAPLFCNQSGKRISKRRVQIAFKTWQLQAGFDRLYPLHALRHTAVTNVYRASRDLFLAQRFARHSGQRTTLLHYSLLLRMGPSQCSTFLRFNSI